MELNRALLVYLGEGRSSWPLGDGDAVTAAFGQHRGRGLVREIKQILSEVEYKMPDTLPQPTLEESWAVNEAALRVAHPELDAEALRAVEWWFFYSHR